MNLTRVAPVHPNVVVVVHSVGPIIMYTCVRLLGWMWVRGLTEHQG
jgi:hypothetical protein